MSVRNYLRANNVVLHIIEQKLKLSGANVIDKFIPQIRVKSCCKASYCAESYRFLVVCLASKMHRWSVYYCYIGKLGQK